MRIRTITLELSQRQKCYDILELKQSAICSCRPSKCKKCKQFHMILHTHAGKMCGSCFSELEKERYKKLGLSGTAKSNVEDDKTYWEKAGFSTLEKYHKHLNSLPNKPLKGKVGKYKKPTQQELEQRVKNAKTHPPPGSGRNNLTWRQRAACKSWS